jgi:hypothetical protein
MVEFVTKLDTSKIRNDGQAYLAELEKRGYVLPSLENLRLKTETPVPQSQTSAELQGFAKDEQQSLNRKQ